MSQYVEECNRKPIGLYHQVLNMIIAESVP